MKKKIQLQNKKLALRKDTIAALSTEAMQGINAGDSLTRTLQSRQVDAGCTGTIFVNGPIITPPPAPAPPVQSPNTSMIANG